MKKLFTLILVLTLLLSNVTSESYALEPENASFETEITETYGSNVLLNSGYENGLFVDEQGVLWNWGYSYKNQETASYYFQATDFSQIPRKINELNDVKGIASVNRSETNAGVIMNDGTLWVWGTNEFGQFGTGQKTDDFLTISQKQMVPGLTNVKSAVIGETNVAVKEDGTVWVWGMKANTADGNHYYENPIKVEQKTELKDIIKADVGRWFGAALDKNGTVWTWGNNVYGRLGHGWEDFGLGNGLYSGTNYPLGAVISDVIDIEVSEDSMIALRKDGTVWGWGGISYGLLPGLEGPSNPQPLRLNNLENIIDISISNNHALALDSNGKVWAWGTNKEGELGTGDTETTVSTNIPPTVIESITDIKSVHAGLGFSMATDENGQIWAWGKNSASELGRGNRLSDGLNLLPKPIEGINLSRENINKLSGSLSSFKSRQKEFHDAHPESFFSDPIDTSTGALIINKSVLGFSNSNNLGITLSYNSLNIQNGDLGEGWSHSFGSNLVILSPEKVRINRTNGQYTDFEKTTENIFKPINATTNYTELVKGSYNFELHTLDNEVYRYDDSGGPVSRYYRKDKILESYSYDYEGRLSKVIFTLPSTSYSKVDKEIHIEYGDNNLIKRFYDLNNREVNLTYDNQHRLTSISDANGNKTTYTYNSNHQILTGTDDSGIIFMKNEYDIEGRVVKQYDSKNKTSTLSYSEDLQQNTITTTTTDRLGNTKKLIHDVNYNLIEVVDSLGNITKYKYDIAGNRVEEINSKNDATLFTYDERKNIKSITNSLGQTYHFSYDGKNNLINSINPKNQMISYTYDSNNNLTKIVDENGSTTSYLYSRDLLVKKTEPSNKVTTYQYAEGVLSKIIDPEGNETTFSSDSIGRIIQKIDPKGNITKYEYDKNDNLLNVTNPLNQKEVYTYNSHNQLVSLKNHKNLFTNSIYDSNGNKSTSSIGSQSILYEYDSEDKLIKETSPSGYSSSYIYNKIGQLVKEVDRLGYETLYDYDSVGNMISETFNLNTTHYSYDSIGNLKTVTNSEGYTTSYEYNELNQKIKEVNPLAQETSYSYDSYGNLSSIVDSLNNTIEYIYDSSKNLTKTIDAKGNTTVFEYDKNNRLVKRINALGQATSYSYDKNGNLIQSFDSLGNVVTKEYDSLNRLIKVTDSLGHSRKTEYDELGNIMAIYDAKGNKVSAITYDDYNNPTTLTDAAGRILSNTYDNENNLIEIIDELNRISKQSHNALGAVVSTIDANEVESISTYNNFGDVSSFVDPNANQTTYLHDKLGQVLKETNAAGNELTYQYDEIGNLTSYKNGRQQEAVLEYDAVGNLVKKTVIDSTIEYGYDANYNLISVTETIGEEIKTTLREYDELNRIIKYTDEFDNTIQYEYDIVGNISKVIYPDGKEVTYTYDAAGNLKTVTDWNNDTTSYTYDENDLLIETLLPNGTSELREYDIKGQLTSLTHKKFNGETIKQDSFTYDAVGNVLSESGNNYKYDNLNRLIKADNNHYAYDNGGNLLSVGKEETDTSEGDLPPEFQLSSLYTYGLDNQLTTYNEMNADFDADGNLLNIPSGVQTLNGVYDSRNRLTALGDTTYQYNAENKRISVTENGEETRFVINPNSSLDQVLMETDVAGVPTAYYVYGLGLISKEEISGEKSYYHFDRRGSTIALTDSIESVTDTYEYDVYGEILQRTNNTENRFLYNGKYGVQTDTSGMYYMRARYYNPEIKRFINRDIVQGSILEPQTLNRYAYVNGNPVSFIDPFGLSREEDTKNNVALNVWNFFIGDDISILLDSNASSLDRAFAGLSLASNFIPGAGPAFKGIKSIKKATLNIISNKKATNVFECNCLVAGTIVVTESGEKAIEDIVVGDQVLSKNEVTGKTDYKSVTGLFSKTSEELYTISIGEEEIVATGEHPFWVEGKEWVLAEELVSGDLFLDSDGQQVEITSIIKSEEQVAVYNFEVEGFHTYFVSDSKIWTHNCAVRLSGTHRELTSQKAKDSHHIIQDAAVRDIKGYNRNDAPAIQLSGPSTSKGSEHHIATSVQRQAGGGTYAAERRIGYRALRRAGVSEERARKEIKRSDIYFESLGVSNTTVTRYPGNRTRKGSGN